jgi:mono/diheme cytochrome c family protein
MSRRAVLLLGLSVALGGCPRPPKRASDGGVDGARLFAATCAKCHGEDGRGATPEGRLIGARDLTRAEVRRMGVAEVAHQVRVGSGKMPAFGDLYSDEELEALAAHIKALP